ncbi:hypothetical protein AAG570_010971 [Ranatra chinensis]|uniref:Dicer-1 n=1 Tax=Ranatra chinensis TaxID=642074 RepID=A0ABD0Z1H2_9HEMI
MRHLTDFRVGEYYSVSEAPNFVGHQVLATVNEVCLQWIQNGLLKWNQINLLVIEDCHNSIRNHPLRRVVLGLKSYEGDVPRILGLTSPLFNNCSVEPGCVEAEVKHLEQDLKCSAETASDIVSTLRYSAHPKEILVEYFNPSPCELSKQLADEIKNVSSFLDDHRYDPTEIYEEEFIDEIRDIPDPKKDPFSILYDFMDVLDSMMLLRRCACNEPSDEEEIDADLYVSCVSEYKPLPGVNVASVNMATAVALVNRYCAKLPSDTFTRLTPLWSVRTVVYNGRPMYSCTVRLPINSPVKQDIVGHPMPSAVLARRVAALETCRVLHTRKELDDQLEPIGKEAFNAGIEDEELSPTHWDPNLPRPGTTKSRQYYYKRIASCLNNCRPLVDLECILYNIDMVLTCPLPEEQNTRGRKLHPPELAPQAFGILTRKCIPKICPFPIFTRSGEVQVSLRLCSSTVVLTKRQVETISAFLNYIFTSVLRLQKYLMSFDPEAEENSFFIVPTKKTEDGTTEVDWEFLEIVYARREETPELVAEEKRKNFEFDVMLYSDAVVMPWYRNQDQPQYFYVAEICQHLSPKSSFPGSDYHTFEDYYHKKYGIKIQSLTQPLLDVDHTSARLNFLTPRYVNRKGVALPTSSEETKRAKRENLEQKQILVPELCLIHVVPASLWRQAVCLPCVLYRINALLLADEIRNTVAYEIGLGIEKLSQDFEWPPLDFGWSLADVLRKSKEENEMKLEEANAGTKNAIDLTDRTVESLSEIPEGKGNNNHPDEEEKENSQSSDEILDDNSSTEKDDWMEIGTWSNEMAKLGEKLDKELPDDLTMVTLLLIFTYIGNELFIDVITNY